MRTRCPACSTVFRVTSEQLRLRAGKVRCGQCQEIFNAFDELVSEDNEPLIVAPQGEAAPAQEETPPEASATPFEAQDGEALAPAQVADADVDVAPDEGAAESLDEPLPAEPAVEIEAEEAAETEESPPEDSGPVTAESDELPIDTETVMIQAPLEEPLLESPEESTQAARQAGLVAAREFGETASFNRWSAGTLASDGQGDFDGNPHHRAAWPFVLVALLLSIALLGQLLYHFRTDIVLRFPGMAGLYELVAVDIPLPRDASLVSIETSDLQSENTRGLFVLQATLKNRAPHAQAWPALELSLTDINDSVVSRRVMFAADYLPPGTTADAFPANGDLAVKLSIEAKNIGASGYRLYIFYP